MQEDEDQRVVVEAKSAEVTTKESRSIAGSVKILLWVTAILLVVAIVSAVRSANLQESVDTLDDKTEALTAQTEEAKDAAIEARDALNKAISQAQSSNASLPIREALASIARIEHELCGGPCDEVSKE